MERSGFPETLYLMQTVNAIMQQMQQFIATERIRSMIVLNRMRRIYEAECAEQCPK